MTSIAARCRLLLAGLTAAALLVTPAAAVAAPAAAAPGCADTPVSQPFAAFGDNADYFLAPGGSFEAGTTGWALRSGAGVVAGNAPFRAVASSDTHALRLPAGSSAVSTPFCIGAEHRTMRFFAQAADNGSLDIDVLYTDAAGRSRDLAIGALAGTGDWAPTDIVPMVVNAMAPARGNAMSVRLRFTPHGSAAWAIDDVLIDPYRVR